MMKMTAILVAAIYAMLAIWGQPEGQAIASANPVAIDRAVAAAVPDYPRPVILGGETDASDPQVTRAAVVSTVVPNTVELAAGAIANPANAPSPGEPFTVSLLRVDEPTNVAGKATSEMDLLASGLLRIDGSRVNMRAGPSTASGVLGSLLEGALAEPLGPVSDGWQEIRVVETGQTGFMAARYLVPF